MIVTPDTPKPSEVEREQAMFVSPKDRLDFYRNEIHNEAGNLSARTNSYLSAQSFLVIAYGSCMANMNPDWGPIFTLVVPPTLALLGILSSLNAWPGIKAACDIIDHWYEKQASLLSCEPAVGHIYDDSPLFSSWESSIRGQRKSLLFSMRSPLLFSAFWLFFGAFSIWLHL
ncbi:MULTISPECIES: hypothetical protein [Pseudomonas]|uniref:hypothetical protein n=1 Tax=Pseudomonas TaxID=286 RepID=UPI0013A76CFF|nr:MULTISPECIES: hypothetical protein [Pseudomonas]QIB52255.1 hypothetical protein G3M63_15090 [Pseudomonas sp. OIL-1]